MPVLGELFKRDQRANEPFDLYQDVCGEPLTVESLLVIREMEGYWIELDHITEQERYPVPAYLREEWEAAVGVDEVNRDRTIDV